MKLTSRSDALDAPSAATFSSSNEYDVVEVAGDRLILKLDDGRMFGVPLPELPEGKLPKRAKVSGEGDKDGVPHKAEFVSFVSE